MSMQRRLIQILELCCSIERRALSLYRELASRDRDSLAPLWMEMAREEAEHLTYWQQLLEMSRAGELPEILDKPEELETFLLELIPKIDRLAAGLEEHPAPTDALVMALRLEFQLLDPRFLRLFHCLYNLPERQSPEKEYEVHLRRLISALNQYGGESPTLALLIESFERTWKISVESIQSCQIDPLTGLFNRRGLSAAMHPLTYLARRQGNPVGVMMLDLDDFKTINDTCGHPAGDRVLTEVSRLLRLRLRASDVIGRYGGEEFLVVMTPTDPQHLSEVAETLRSSVEKNPVDGIRVTISIGAAFAVLRDGVEKEIEELIRQADQSLLTAKRTGKNRVVCWRADLHPAGDPDFSGAASPPLP